MTELLTDDGYEQSCEKVRELESRLADLERRDDLSASHKASVRRSYYKMIRKLRQDILLFEAHRRSHPVANDVET